MADDEKAGGVSRDVLNGWVEDVQAVAEPILRHRLVRNYKAEAEGVTAERIIRELL